MRRLILGTAGHIDHGKTALIQALTGTDTDRLPEEKRRGITIDLGFARLALPDGSEVGIVDVPGHEGFVRNMLAGATGIDLALLVIAADEGVMPQTREHVAIVELLGVEAIIVALTKIDLVEPEWIELATEDARGLLAGGAYGDAPIVPVSARSGAGLDVLVGEIARTAEAVHERSTADLFRLPIDRIFSVHGTGTVVTGTVWSGSVGREDTVRLLPEGRKVRIRAIQSHGTDRDAVGAGERAAIALAATGREDLERGNVLVMGEGWEPSNRLTIRLRAIDAADRGIRHAQRVRFHLATTEAIGRIVSAGNPLLEPGDEDWVQIRLEAPVVARAGDPFVIRSYSPVTTIGGGRVGEPAAPRRKHLSGPERLALDTVLRAKPAEAMAARTVLAGWAGETVDHMAVTTPCAPVSLKRADLDPAYGRARDGRRFHPDVIRSARDALLETVDQHHEADPLGPGLHLEHFRRALPTVAPQSLVELLIADLEAAGSLEVDGNHVRRSNFRPSLTADQEQAAARILAELDRAGLAAPSRQELPPDLAERHDLEDLLHYLVRRDDLLALGAGRFVRPHALHAAVNLASETFGERGALTPGDFRDLFGLSRKFLIPLLEHFDRTGVTIRDGEGRRMAPRASSRR